MSALPQFLQVAILIFVVLMVFNLIIFVHELGHFLAARWRGLHVDRFQIWFGKPLWKKTINGVQYGLGSIPAGGFVSLPQMAPMEMLEGTTTENGEPLPPISPLDKIIVAFAGPLFSMLLALACGVIVWQIGKPADIIETQVIGFVVPDSPAQKAGLHVGDRVLAVNGKPVDGFLGNLDSVKESIIFSRGDSIRFTIERPGVQDKLDITSGFQTDKTKWYQRKGLRYVGIGPASPAIVASVVANSPAQKAGLAKGDRILAVDGRPLHSPEEFSIDLEAQGWKTVNLRVAAPDGSERDISITPERPLKPAKSKPTTGIDWDFGSEVKKDYIYPTPFKQVTGSLRNMWVTITSVVSPKSGVGVGHLSGPLGIGRMQYLLLQLDDGWRRLLGFMVFFNVNLAVLNMLPFPVLDGGHITLAILEKICGRPIKAKPLEILQTACALALISLMLFITTKDAGDFFGGGGAREEVVFPEN